jgi:DNA repair photolyase
MPLHSPSRPRIPIVPLQPGTKGRGTLQAMAHRYEGWDRESFDDGWGGDRAEDPAQAEPEIWRADASAHHGQAAGQVGGGATALLPSAPGASVIPTVVTEEHSRSILTRNDSPDIGFELSVNPYRGCEHGCIYCYARPTHAWLDLSPGVDFETRIVAKTNAAALLRQAFDRPGYTPRALCLGTVTDAYQPAERERRLTRGVIEVLAQYRHAFSIVTKSALVERDLDLIAPMARERLAAVWVSVTTLDAELARRLEPRAAAPHRRLQTIERLARAGVPVGVSISPLVPFLNEPELEAIVAAAASAGARSAFSVVLRLPWEVAPLFRQWLQTHVPDRAGRIMARVRELRGGRDNDPRFGTRMRGEGPWAELLGQRLHAARLRHGLTGERVELDLTRFSRPAQGPQRQASSPAAMAPPAQRELF